MPHPVHLCDAGSPHVAHKGPSAPLPFFFAPALSLPLLLPPPLVGGGDVCQYQVGMMCWDGEGVAVDDKQARLWLEKAAAQDEPHAVGQLGIMYFEGTGVTPSWRRARELYQRAIELGSSQSVENMQHLTKSIQEVS